MPLSEPDPRREVHHRTIDMKTYAREDGLFDVEAHLVDRKPFDFVRLASKDPTPAGSALHDLRIRMTIDADLVVRKIEASGDVMPYEVCREATETLGVLVGQRIARGWSTVVKQRLRGAACCTHLMEMLMPAATTALQGIRALVDTHRRALNDAGEPVQLDSCYAYARHREPVARLWPQHHRPKPSQK